MSPTTVAALPRISSAVSGFRFWGSADDPVLTSSDSFTQPNSRDDHITISSANRDRSIIDWAQQNTYSETKSLDATASSELGMTPSSPRLDATISLSRGREEPAEAPAPKGESRIRLSESANRSAPRIAIQAYTSR